MDGLQWNILQQWMMNRGPPSLGKLHIIPKKTPSKVGRLFLRSPKMADELTSSYGGSAAFYVVGMIVQRSKGVILIMDTLPMIFECTTKGTREHHPMIYNDRSQ